MNRLAMIAATGALGLLLAACGDNSKPTVVVPADSKTTVVVPANGEKTTVVVPDESKKE